MFALIFIMSLVALTVALVTIGEYGARLTTIDAVVRSAQQHARDAQDADDRVVIAFQAAHRSKLGSLTDGLYRLRIGQERAAESRADVAAMHARWDAANEVVVGQSVLLGARPVSVGAAMLEAYEALKLSYDDAESFRIAKAQAIDTEGESTKRKLLSCPDLRTHGDYKPSCPAKSSYGPGLV